MLTTFTAFASSIVRRDDEDGQGLAEYALILALIAIVAIIALIFLGGQISDRLSVVGDAQCSGVRHSLTARRVIPAGFLLFRASRPREVHRTAPESRLPCSKPYDDHGICPFPPKGPSPIGGVRGRNPVLECCHLSHRLGEKLC